MWISQEKLKNNPKIEFLFSTNIVRASGEHSLESVVIENVLTKEQKLLALDGIFVNIGVVPKTQLYQSDIELDAASYIKAGETCETQY